MKHRQQKGNKCVPVGRAQSEMGKSRIVPRKNWLSKQGTFFSVLIALIGLTSIVIPYNFYLFSVNSQCGLPITVQILWTIVAIVAVVLADRNVVRHVPDISIFVLASTSILSFFVWRTAYPTLLGDGRNSTMHFILLWNPLPRIQDYLYIQLSSIIPRNVHFSYHPNVLFDNQLINNTSIIVTLVLAIVVIALIAIVIRRLKTLSNGEKVGLFVLLACSATMLNGYGHFCNYMETVFAIFLWYVCLWFIFDNPTAWYSYAVLPFLFAFCLLSHPILWHLPGILLMMLGFVFLKSRRIAIPLWLVSICAVAVACAPLILLRSRADPYLARLRFDDTFGLHIYTRLLCCLEVSFPALILAGLAGWRNREKLKTPTPIQATALIVLISSFLFFFTSQIEMAICTILQYSLFGSMIYGAAIVLYLSTTREPRDVFYAAIVGCFLFVPAAYVHSNSLLLERQLALFPYDRSSTTYQGFGPYLKLGLNAPIDTSENHRLKLAIFRAGVTTSIPDWQQFRGLNMLFYTAWSFEFGEVEEGKKCLVQLFSQPQALQDLWHSGTRFTAFSENKAYKRIRQVSRKIIQENLSRTPADRYFQQLSSLLEVYEQKDP